MKRILIYRLGSLGDTIVALPFFNQIADLYPEHERIVLTNAPVSTKAAPLLSVLGTEIVHRSIAYPVGTRDPLELLRLIRDLRARRADGLIYLMPSRSAFSVRRDALFFRACGFKNIVGLTFDPDQLQCRISATTGEEEPECERLGRAMAALGPLDLNDRRNWDLHLTPAELARGDAVIAALGGPYIAINMGGKAAQKDWGEANWHETLAAFDQRHGPLGLLVVGAPEDSERVQRVRGGWSGVVFDGCGKLSPRESAAAMRKARFFAGHDSGPLHLASAAGVNCLGLFGDFNRPRKWHPYVGANVTLHDMRGVQAISGAAVLDAMETLLARSLAIPSTAAAP